MARPIPKSRLPHAISLETYIENDGIKPTYQAARDITFVKVDSKKTYSTSTGGFEVIGSSIMFVDTVNTSPILTKDDLLTKSKITFKGKETHIIDVEELYDSNDKVHHWEVVLK